MPSVGWRHRDLSVGHMVQILIDDWSIIRKVMTIVSKHVAALPVQDFYSEIRDLKNVSAESRMTTRK